MAKKAQQNQAVTPPVLPGEPDFQGPASTPAAAAPVVELPDARMVMIELPMRAGGAVIRRTFDKSLSGRHARVMREILDGCLADGATLDNGRKVTTLDDTLVYLLEQIEKASLKNA